MIRPSTFASAIVLGALSMTPNFVMAQTSDFEFSMTQPATEHLARLFIGANVTNMAGEIVGDVNDLLFDKSGRITTVVLGVGGFLGMGEKNVAIPFSALLLGTGVNGARTIVIAASKDRLKSAPLFVPTEKTTFEYVRDKATDLGHKTTDKAIEIKDQAVKKIEDMGKIQPLKK
jgi:sporulation protein YlmC with PRC-barrel domain